MKKTNKLFLHFTVVTGGEGFEEQPPKYAILNSEKEVENFLIENCIITKGESHFQEFHEVVLMWCQNARNGDSLHVSKGETLICIETSQQPLFGVVEAITVTKVVVQNKKFTQ